MTDPQLALGTIEGLLQTWLKRENHRITESDISESDAVRCLNIDTRCNIGEHYMGVGLVLDILAKKRSGPAVPVLERLLNELAEEVIPVPDTYHIIGTPQGRTWSTTWHVVTTLIQIDTEEARCAVKSWGNRCKGHRECEEALERRLADHAEAKREADNTITRLGDWQYVGGTEATRIAESARVAPSGTFSAAVLQWEGSGKAPFSVTIGGTIGCAYCSTSTRFSVDSMSAQVRCGGCGAVYSIFNTDKEFAEGKDGRVIAVSVFSHTQGTPVRVPQIEIDAVTNAE